MKKLILLILLLAMAAANATAARMYPAGGRVVDEQGQAVEYATVVLLRGGEQVAGMALLKALERFDPARGFRFVTYAVPTITGDVRNYLRDKSGLMRMPRDMRQRLYQMTQEQERFEREHLRTPTAVELSERMGIAPEEFLALLALRTQNEAVSLDTPVGEEGDTQLSDLLGSTDDRFERMERSEWAQWLLSKVGDTERELLTLRYRDGLGQRETARRLGISQMQVSRLERRALSRLRAMEAQA